MTKGTSSSRQRIGFIGLGAMGLPMAKNLARKLGCTVQAYDVRSDILANVETWGGKAASSPADVTRESDIVITMLPDETAVLKVLCGAGGVIEGARAGLSVIDFSTIGPWALKEAAVRLAAKGASVHGGAVTLGVAAAEKGELAVYLDSMAADDPQIKPVVAAFSKTIIPTGDLANSKLIKLINNLMVAVNVAATAEAVAVAAKAGLPPEALVPLIRKGSGASYALNNHIANAAITGDTGPGKFGVNYILKDLEIAQEMARRTTQTAFFGALSVSAYRGTKAMGYGPNYYPIVLRWIELAAGQAAAGSKTTGRT
ncbi:MAG: NAD(P)-dependent oxidoreductase [Hyphomicrobiaceae bacterium]